PVPPPASALRPNATSRRLSSSSSTGLDPTVAAALAYLAGPFSGALILLAERTSPFVRFHAWQSIIGLGGLGALAAGMLVFAFVALIISSTAFTLMYRVAALTALVWVGIWFVSVLHAARGNTWRMPLAGKFAARLAPLP